MDLKKLLREMVSIHAPSGYEERMAEYLWNIISSFADEISTDVTGNVIARFKGTQNSVNRIMVFAHMDQLGLIVKTIENEGYIRFERLGGVPERILPGLVLNIINDEGEIVEGVCGMKSHHITGPEEKYIVKQVSELYIDIGAKSKAEVDALGVAVGNPIVYKPFFLEMGEGRISATSIDNRAGCAIIACLAELLFRNPPQCDVFIVGTATEEFNLRGAITAAQIIKPNMAICVDSCVSSDTPDTKGSTAIYLGGGPVMSMYNFHGRGTLNGLIPHPAMVRLVKDAAKKTKLPLQRVAMSGLLTDASYVQLVGTGVASIDLCIPLRYTHSPIETCEFADIEKLCELLFTIVNGIDKDFSLERLDKGILND